MEELKFKADSERYKETLQEILKLGFSAEDYIHHNPAFNGFVNIARYLALYEAYKLTMGLSGHIAEIGVWKGATLLYFAKLVEIFEPHSYTLAHGFDWFEGMEEDDEHDFKGGSYAGQYQTLRKLIELQGLDRIVRLHKMDVRNELPKFFEENPSPQFKLVFVDCGVYDVVKATMTHFWPRLVSGGVMVFDEYNDQRAPGETVALKEFLPDTQIRNFQFSRQSSSYVIKP